MINIPWFLVSHFYLLSVQSYKHLKLRAFKEWLFRKTNGRQIEAWGFTLEKSLLSESILSLTFWCSRFVDNWKIYLLVSEFKKRHYEHHRNNYLIPNIIWAVYEKNGIVLVFSFLKFWFLVYIQIASNNHNKLRKTLSCTVNKSVLRYMTYYTRSMTYYSEEWHCTAILMILWNQDVTFKRC